MSARMSARTGEEYPVRDEEALRIQAMETKMAGSRVLDDFVAICGSQAEVWQLS